MGGPQDAQRVKEVHKKLEKEMTTALVPSRPPVLIDTVTFRLKSGNSYILTASKDGKISARNSAQPKEGSWTLDTKILDVPLGRRTCTIQNLQVPGSKMQIADYLEKYYPQGHNGIKILCIWATFCNPCLASLPKLPEYQKNLNAFKAAYEKKFNIKLPDMYVVPVCALAVNEGRKSSPQEVADDLLDARNQMKWAESACLKVFKYKYPLPFLASKDMMADMYPSSYRGSFPNFVIVDEKNAVRMVADYYTSKGAYGAQNDGYDNTLEPDFISIRMLYPYFEYLRKNADKK